MSDSNKNSNQIVADKLTAFELDLQKLDALSNVHASIAAKLEEANAEEAVALGIDDDAKAIAGVIQARTLKDVHSARLVDVTAKIQAQKRTVIANGRAARSAVAEIQQALAQNRYAQSVAFLKDYFVGVPLGAEHLARFNRSYLDAVALGGSLKTYDGDQELASLRQLRSNFDKITDEAAK